ncbi:Uu.00g097800.m01.CDS01 [Anthostomella pinea]|uniref:Uu.00g097800.m01.CDS01 n=1 Tax=Anthostomella pinea TaxID=933095 RepID=A0AAI8VCJ9_9PEZI|nr:Uu.00g097800.m01.CDS01 [Anthostomella pinea]
MSSLVHYPVLGYVQAELIVNCVVVFLVLVTVILRIAARLMGPGLGWDDWLILFATPLGVAMLVCQALFAPIGNGYSLEEHPELAANIVYILQVTFGMQIIYVTLLAIVKMSMLAFFIRVFVTPAVQRAAKITFGVLIVWMIAYICACIFICNPVEAQWTGAGQCGAYIHMIQSLIATNALFDVVIMAIPMHGIWTLQMRKTDKIGIMGCFALGLACVVCAIFRIVYISTVALNSNVTGTMPTTIFLFILEPNLAILCCCIPMLRPFYIMYKKRMGGSRLHEDSDERLTGFNKSGSGPEGGRGLGLGTRARSGTGNGSDDWEMGAYHHYKHPDREAKHEAMVNAYGDEGSEKNLTDVASPPVPRDVIGVQTSWAVTRD